LQEQNGYAILLPEMKDPQNEESKELKQMYKVYFTNFGYFSADTFATLDAAIAKAKSVCFECSIVQNNETVATWSSIGGLRMVRR
jgi:hypothetical protein